MLDKNVERLLSEPWGAAQAGVQYNKEVLGSLCEQFSRLEPQARRGALQGTLFMRKGQRDSLKNEVRTLVDLATDDKDQWVSLIARALGGLRERFDLQQLQQDVPAVADAVASIRDKIQVDGTPDSYRPMEEMYLSPRLLAAAGAPPCEASAPTHGHFTPRARREPKKRFAGTATASVAPKTTVQASRPASTSMFAPPSRKPAVSFLRDTGPSSKKTGAASAKSFLSRGRDTGTKTMMIDVNEAAALGQVMGEDLNKAQRELEKKEEQEAREQARERERVEREQKKKLEQEQKKLRIQKMMEERENKKKLELERKRARDEELAKRKDDAKRPRTEAPSRDEVSTPSPHESDPIHTVI